MKTPDNFVIIRTKNAGVHVGILVERRGDEVDLSAARRVWSWKGANSLHEIALHGVKSGSRVSETVARITVLEVIEVILGTPEAYENLMAAKWS